MSVRRKEVRPCEQRGKGQQRGDRHGKAGTAAGGEAQAGRAEAGGGEGNSNSAARLANRCAEKRWGYSTLPAGAAGAGKKGERRGVRVFMVGFDYV